MTQLLGRDFLRPNRLLQSNGLRATKLYIFISCHLEGGCIVLSSASITELREREAQNLIGPLSRLKVTLGVPHGHFFSVLKYPASLMEVYLGQFFYFLGDRNPKPFGQQLYNVYCARAKGMWRTRKRHLVSTFCKLKGLTSLEPCSQNNAYTFK